MLGCFQGLRYVRTCMRNELHGSCGFVRKNFLCLIVSVLFLDFQAVSLFVFSFNVLFSLFVSFSSSYISSSFTSCIAPVCASSFKSILSNSPAFHLLLSLLLILLHLLQVVLTSWNCFACFVLVCILWRFFPSCVRSFGPFQCTRVLKLWAFLGFLALRYTLMLQFWYPWSSVWLLIGYFPS